MADEADFELLQKNFVIRIFYEKNARAMLDLLDEKFVIQGRINAYKAFLIEKNTKENQITRTGSIATTTDNTKALDLLELKIRTHHKDNKMTLVNQVERSNFNQELEM